MFDWDMKSVIGGLRANPVSIQCFAVFTENTSARSIRNREGEKENMIKLNLKKKIKNLGVD